MTALIGLRSYLSRYRAFILGGFLFIILANAVALIQPYLDHHCAPSLNDPKRWQHHCFA